VETGLAPPAGVEGLVKSPLIPASAPKQNKKAGQRHLGSLGPFIAAPELSPERIAVAVEVSVQPPPEHRSI
jgi:hypothetical protein